MDATGTRKGKDETVVSVIGPGVTINGEVTCEVDLQIDGRVTGDVRCPTLLLGETGTINGSVEAERVRVAGRIDGSITSGDLAIEATGLIDGDASYTRLKVTPGGRIRGRLEPRDETVSAGEPAGLKLVETPMASPQVIRVFGE